MYCFYEYYTFAILEWQQTSIKLVKTSLYKIGLGCIKLVILLVLSFIKVKLSK